MAKKESLAQLLSLGVVEPHRGNTSSKAGVLAIEDMIGGPRGGPPAGRGGPPAGGPGRP